MKIRGLRWKIVVWSALSSCVALLVFSAGAAFYLYREQLKAADLTLDTQARVFFAELDEQHLAPDYDDPSVRADLVGRNDDIRGFAFGPRDRPPVACFPATLGPLASRTVAANHRLNLRLDGRPVRLARFDRPAGTLVLALDLSETHEVVFDLLAGYLLCTPIVALMVGLGGWLIARHALRPIGTIAEAADRISARHLHERLPDVPDDELGRLTRVLNAMIERIEQGFLQARRFTADASHELRTPLTVIRAGLEETLRVGGYDQAREEALVALLDETLRLQRISDSLLLLARFDAGRVPVPSTRVDFSALVDEVLSDIHVLAEPRALQIDATLRPGLHTPGDAILLQRVLFNLLENAVKYNHDRGVIRILLEHVPGPEKAIRLTVANTGPAIRPDDESRLFQRFARLGESRDRATGGAGIGLSLAREIAQAHGGSLTFSGHISGENTFVLILPAADFTGAAA